MFGSAKKDIKFLYSKYIVHKDFFHHIGKDISIVNVVPANDSSFLKTYVLVFLDVLKT